MKTIRIIGHPNSKQAAELKAETRKVFDRYIPGDVASLEDPHADELRRAGLAEPMVTLRLIRHYRQLNAGEIAGFGEKEAKGMVEDEIAVPVSKDAPQAAAR